MKKFLLTVVIFLAILFPVSVCAENDDITVCLNGEYIEFDVKPQIIDGRTMVPIRAIFETFGATVSWENETQTAICTKDSIVVQMSVGNTVMSIGNQSITMDVAPVVIDGRVLAPVRYVADSMGAEVQWSNKNRMVVLTTNAVPVYVDYYNVPDIGKFWGVELLYEDESSQYSGLHIFTYKFEDVSKKVEENPEHANRLDEIMATYGYELVEQHEKSYYANSISRFYGNPHNADYVVRIVWRVLGKNDEEVTIVEIEPTKQVVNAKGETKTIPLTELELWTADGWLEIGIKTEETFEKETEYKKYDESEDIVDFGDFCDVELCSKIITDEYICYQYPIETEPDRVAAYLKFMKEKGYDVVHEESDFICEGLGKQSFILRYGYFIVDFNTLPESYINILIPNQVEYETYADSEDIVDFGAFCGVEPCSITSSEYFTSYYYPFDETSDKLLEYMNLMKEKGYIFEHEDEGVRDVYYAISYDESFIILMGLPIDFTTLDMYIIIMLPNDV